MFVEALTIISQYQVDCIPEFETKVSPFALVIAPNIEHAVSRPG